MPDKPKKTDSPIIKNDTIMNDDWMKIFPEYSIERKIINELAQEYVNNNEREYPIVSS